MEHAKPMEVFSGFTYEPTTTMTTRFAFLLLLIGSPLAAAPEVFQPSFSEFSVTFPRPSTKKSVSFVDVNGAKGEGLVAEVATDRGFMRAEFTPLPDPRDAGMTDEEIKQRALEFAVNNGLTGPYATIERVGNLRVGSVRGTKFVTSNDKRIPVTYVAKVYLGKRSMMFVCTGAPSAIYPTDEITTFFKSVSKR